MSGMSKRELVEAYVDGRLGRRTFVKRLVAAGVSTAAATAYAAALAPRAHAQGTPFAPVGNDFYNRARSASA